MKPAHARMGISFALAVLSWTRPSLSADINQPVSRKAPPAFTLSDARGTPISLSNYKGKVVLLDVWATWCTGCKVEIPWYIEFHKKYRRQGLEALGVAMDEEGWSKVTPYLKEHPIPYTIVMGDENFAKRYSVTAMPVTMLIDRHGRTAATYVGLVNKVGFEKDLQRLLRE
jgi:thiol-disulfide isomerase/thioredoxin